MNWRLLILIIGILVSGLDLPLYSQCTITISEENPCSGQEVSIGVDDPNTSSDYSWDLDNDGTVDIQGSVFFDYAFPETFSDRTFSITLFRDGSACSTINVPVKAAPDPTIGVPQGVVTLEGNELKACNADGMLELEIFNASTTMSDNASYSINWGDGSATETFDNSTFTANSTISHTYNSFGYFTIFVSVEHTNGCVYTRNYTLYNGGNPSVGLANPGNTVGLCAPATLTFPITNTSGNPPGTEYHIFINGEEVATYTQEDLPPSFTYTFDVPSCGIRTSTGNYENAFDLKIVASNPCNSSAATIEPIEVSTPPDPDFEITPPAYSCTGAVYGFNNMSDNVNEVRSGNPSECLQVLSPTWNISGTNGEDWEVVNGNLFNANSVGIRFNKAGTYTIEMTLVSFACGDATISKEITIFEQPEVDGDVQVLDVGAGPNGEECSPYKFEFTSQATGDIQSYTWKVESDQDWDFIEGTGSESPNPKMIFYGGGEYQVTLSVINSCNTVEWDTLITLQGRPTVVLDVPNYCEQATINFDNSIVQYGANGYAIDRYDWTFEGAQPGTSSDPNPSGINYSQPGEYIVRLRAGNTCGSITVRDTFLIQARDDLMLPPDQALCITADPINLDAGLTGGTWSGPGVSSSGKFDPTKAQVGTNTLTYSYGAGVCLLEEEMTVTVNPLPDITLDEDQEFCTTRTSVELSPTPADGTWQLLNGGVLNGNTFMISESGPGTYGLAYSITDANGCSAQDTMQLTVLSGPVLTASDTTYCNTPKDQQLPAVTPAGGVWTGRGVFTDEDDNTIFNPFAAGGAGIHTLTYYYIDETTGCDSSIPIQASVVDPIKVDAGEDQALCDATEPIDLAAAATPPGGFWTREDGSPLEDLVFDPTSVGNGIYKFAYEVGNGACVVTDTIEFNISDPENFDIGADESVCANGEEFRLSGTGGAGGFWTGPGIVDSINGFFDPAGLSPGDYEVTFTRQDENVACPGQDSKLVTVRQPPAPGFDAPTTVCIDTPFDFVNTSQGANTYAWDFGDGSGSTNREASHSYDEYGAYIISLATTNTFGCRATFIDTLEVAPPPTSEFNILNDEGCGPLRVEFDNLSQGENITYEWDFGNGQTSTRAVPLDPVIYQTNRRDTTFIISLRTSNGCGSDISRDTVLVYPFPLANFGFSVDTGCAPVLATFANISQGSPESWFWDFGNGVTSTERMPQPQLFTAEDDPVTYDIMLVAGNACGNDTIIRPLVVFPDQVEAFLNLSNNRGCAPYDLQLESFSSAADFTAWDFGDGQSGSGTQVNHVYSEPGTYTVKLNVGNGCSEDSTTAQVTVLPSPDLDFAHSPNLCVEQEIFFQNNSGPLANLKWDFGTGDTSTLGNPIYVFPAPGTYDVRLIGAIAESGCRDTLVKTLTIAETPYAQISGVDLEGCAPYPAAFSSQGSIGDYYQWDFGDGNTSVARNPQHLFTQPGNYTVQLTVSDEQGCRVDTVLSGITVFPTPQAGFNLPELSCGLPLALNLENTSTAADGYDWRLSNGMSSTLRSPQLTISQATDLDIMLVAGNQFGCRDSLSRSIVIRDEPIADFILDPGEGCDPLPVFITNYSKGDRFMWDFGDGATSEESQPVHTYRRPGTYDITLIASFDGICVDTLRMHNQVIVHPSPFADFEWVPVTNNGFTTRTINFVNRSKDADSYFWDFGDGITTDEEHPSHTYDQSTAWQVLLRATNEQGCSDDTLMVVEPSFIGRLFTPNAFAPEQGLGDARVFLPKGVGIQEYHLQIFSPYGELLWESTKLENGQPAEGWDGTHNGHPLPMDVYVWKIKAIFEDGTHWMGHKTASGAYKRLGSVTLIR